MSDQWHIFWGDQPYGPCTSDQLRELVRLGRLRPTDQVCYTATQQWFSAGEIEGLFPAPSPAVNPVHASAPASAYRPAPAPHAEPESAYHDEAPLLDEEEPPLLDDHDEVYPDDEEEEKQAARAPTRRRPREESISPMYWLLPTGGAVVMGLITVAILFSGRRGPSNTQEARPSPPRRTVTPPPAASTPRVIARETGPNNPIGPVKEVPSYAGVDYNTDFSDLDYKKGPQGQPLVKRKDPKDGLITLIDGYEDGVKGFVDHGVQLTQDVDGNKKVEIYFFDGKRHGPYREWHDNGTLAVRGAYKNGLKHGRWISYGEKGKLESDVLWFNGKEHGRELLWYPDGKKKSEGYFVNGVRQGSFIQWYPNGQVQRQGKYKDGKEDDSWTNYDDKGNKQAADRKPADKS